MIILGIVGTPAGGKSTVARRLQELGATWINADQIARSVLQQPNVQQELLNHFGSEIADNAGQIDRSKLAAQVFGDDDSKRAALTYLEGIIHPRTRLIITDKLRESERQGIGVAILDVPLLFEVGWDRTCDEIWCVDAQRRLRLARARDRGWSDDELDRRESNQLGIDEKRRLSTLIIENNGTLEELYRTIDRQWDQILRRQSEHHSTSTRHCLEDN